MRYPHPRRYRFAVATAALAGLLLTAGAVPASADTTVANVVVMTPALQKKIEGRLKTFFTNNTLPGLSAAVVTSDPTGTTPVVTTFAFGTPIIGSSTLVDASTQFELGSETKAFTADLLAYLVASGEVSLDDTVQKYAPAGITVPSWTDLQTGTVTPITLRDLATHQAGLPDVATNFEAGCAPLPQCENPHPGYTQAMLWEGISQQALYWQPGTNWLYSNWGFGLLGTILSNVVNPVSETDPPAYQSTIDGAFLSALGMTSTELETATPNLATPYDVNGAATYYWNNTNAISGAGGLISNATDMGAWVAAHLGYVAADAPLSVQSMADTLTQVGTITTQCSSPFECSPTTLQSGLAWQLYPAGTQNMTVDWAFKNGGTAGSSTDTALAPSLKVGVSTMFNMERANNDEVAVPILAILAEAQTPAVGIGETPAPGVPDKLLPAMGHDQSELLLGSLAAIVLMAAGALALAGGRARRNRRYPR